MGENLVKDKVKRLKWAGGLGVEGAFCREGSAEKFACQTEELRLYSRGNSYLSIVFHTNPSCSVCGGVGVG